MLNLSNIVKVEKNKLTIDSVFLILLEINIPSITETIRIVNNNEDIEWNTYTWQKFPFDIDEIPENSTAEISQFSIKVGNANNVIGQYVRQYEKWIKENQPEDITCTLYIVNTKDLENTEPIYSTRLILSDSKTDFIEVSFTVSARDVFNSISPIYSMYPNNCRFRFKSTECGYTGEGDSCDKTLPSCRTYGNSIRFGGFPTIGNKGVSL